MGGLAGTLAWALLRQELLRPLDWQRYCDGTWCRLAHLNLSDPHFDAMAGVYVIWYQAVLEPVVVDIGQGFIEDRLYAHRMDPSLWPYWGFGLRVTWAAVPSHLRDGVERYLADRLHPLIGRRYPDVPPIPVTLPW
jgi:hypothetical protein